MCVRRAQSDCPGWVTLKMESRLPGMGDPKMLDTMSELESEASQLNVRKGGIEEAKHQEKN